MTGLAAGELDKQISIERPVADASFKGAGSGTWEVVEADVWAGIKDVLPSRGEKIAEGLNVSTRPARVRMRYREDVTPDMRFVYGARVMQITAGPAEIGTRDGVEFMVEEYRPAGNGA